MSLSPEINQGSDVLSLCDKIFDEAYMLFLNGQNVIDTSGDAEVVYLEVPSEQRDLIVSRPFINTDYEVDYWIDFVRNGFEGSRPEGLLALKKGERDTLFETDLEGLPTDPADLADTPDVRGLLQKGEIVAFSNGA